MTTRISASFAAFIILVVSLTAHSEEKAVEEDPFAAVTPGFYRRDIPQPTGIGPLIVRDGCFTGSYVQNRGWLENANTTGHINGKHAVGATFKNRCRCTPDCTNLCLPDTSDRRCIEEGSLEGPKPEGYKHIPGGITSKSTNGAARIGNDVNCKASLSCTIASTDSSEGMISSLTIEHQFTCEDFCTRQLREPLDSPIVLNLDGKPFAFSDEDNTVTFDLDNDGAKENLSWTLENSSTAFLALDINNNGMIDNGKELFGSYTQQPDTPRPNGYLALQVYDDNEDGVITVADTVFQRLLLWTDRNHNGISEQSELAPVYRHLTSIGLDYIRSDRVDSAGNELALFGEAVTINHKTIFTVDVIFFQVFYMKD